MPEHIPIDLALAERLRRSPLLGSLTDGQFQLLLEGSELVKCKLGTVICEARKTCNDLYVLASGKVRLTLQDEHGEESTLYILARTGDFFGAERNNGAPSFSARASGETVLLRIKSASVEQICSECDSFCKCLEQAQLLWYWHKKLRTAAPLNNLNYWQMHSLLLHCTSLTLRAGDTATSNAGQIDGLGVVISGAVEIQQGNIAETAGVGELFGLDVLQGKQINLSIKALKDSELVVLSKTAYEDLRRFNHDLVAELDSLLSVHQTSRQSTVLPGTTALTDSATVSSLASVPVAPPIDQRPQPLDKETLAPRLRRAFRRYPHIYQQNEMDCGAASLGMVSLFYGKRIDMNQLRHVAGVGRYGTSLLSLAEAAEQLGFVGRGMRATYEGLLKLKLPLICFWKSNHFVVLYEIHKSHAIIGDPAEGVLRVERKKFTRDYSGAVLEILPTQQFGKGFKAKSPLVSLLPLLIPFKSTIRDVFVASFIFQGLLMVIPLFTQVIVDKVIVHQSLSMLNIMLLGMVLFSLFETAIAFLRGFLLAYLSTKVDQSLIVQFYRHLLSLPLKFFEERTTGDILVRFEENQKIRDLISGSAITVILDALMIGLYLAIICSYNIAFGLSVFFYLGLFVAVVMCYTPILKQFSRRVFNRHVESSSFLVESIRGIEKIKASAAEHRTRWKWETLFTDALNVRFHELLAINVAHTISKLLHIGGQIMLLWLGAHLVIGGKLTIGQLMALNMMVSMVSQPVMRIIEMWDQLQDVNIALERLGDVLETEPEEADPSTKIQLTDLKGTVKFDSVTFRYTSHAESNTLVNVSLDASAGQMAAIVGRSGSGKSTILKLIQGLYLPLNGHIYIDGLDITHVSLAQLRKHIGVVSQHEYLFRGTVRENLSLYKPEAPLDEIIESATIAGIHDFVLSLPMGYETPLSEGGFNVSGGQRQRLAIARAILHKPRILIFDEATSALDSESERRIQSSMETIRRGRTMFVVAHRLSTVRDADIIFVIDRGQIVEKGTHESLVAEKGLYYYLCSQQLAL